MTRRSRPTHLACDEIVAIATGPSRTVRADRSMGTALLILRLLLVATFALAAVGKLVDRNGTRRSLAQFGVPAALLGPGVIVLPTAELAVALSLPFQASARGAAIACAILLLAFAVAIARNVAAGRPADCGCFGAVRIASAGTPAVVRNLVLLAMAVTVGAGGPGQSLTSALAGVDSALLAGVLIAAVLLVAQLAFNWQLLRQNERLLERLAALESAPSSGSSAAPRPGLAVGTPAPPLELPDLDGHIRSLGDLLAPGVPLLLAFAEPSCGACVTVAEQLARLRAAQDGSLEVALVSRGTSDENRRAIGAGTLATVLLQEEREVALRYGVASVPSALLVSPDGRIASELAIGAFNIEKLASPAAATLDPPLLSVVAG